MPNNLNNEENFMLVSLDDDKSKEIAEVISSPTCRKVINYLAERKEASQKDLADALHISLNTLDYNIKKLLSSGFIQKRKNFFWSKKGKKIIMYELSRKSIVISHKNTPAQKLKSIVPAVIVAAAGTIALWAYEKINSFSQTAPNLKYDAGVMEASQIVGASSSGTNFISSIPAPVWIWFATGAFVAIIIFSLVNWRKL